MSALPTHSLGHSPPPPLPLLSSESPHISIRTKLDMISHNTLPAFCLAEQVHTLVASCRERNVLNTRECYTCFIQGQSQSRLAAGDYGLQTALSLRQEELETRTLFDHLLKCHLPRPGFSLIPHPLLFILLFITSIYKYVCMCVHRDQKTTLKSQSSPPTVCLQKIGLWAGLGGIFLINA